MRILIFGNSGSGKSTLAGQLAESHALPSLDLDTIVWEPGQVALQRPPEAVLADLQAFLEAHDSWIVEGCYGELIEEAAVRCTKLIFLNPGVDNRLANNRRRPWEPRKYASPEEQDAMLAPLQEWVKDYYERDGSWSYAAHRMIFDAHPGDKVEYT